MHQKVQFAQVLGGKMGAKNCHFLAINRAVFSAQKQGQTQPNSAHLFPLQAVHHHPKAESHFWPNRREKFMCVLVYVLPGLGYSKGLDL